MRTCSAASKDSSRGASPASASPRPVTDPVIPVAWPSPHPDPCQSCQQAPADGTSARQLASGAELAFKAGIDPWRRLPQRLPVLPIVDEVHNGNARSCMRACLGFRTRAIPNSTLVPDAYKHFEERDLSISFLPLPHSDPISWQETCPPEDICVPQTPEMPPLPPRIGRTSRPCSYGSSSPLHRCPICPR